MFYGILIISLIITLSAQAFVSMTYSKTKKIKNINNITGCEVARQILDNNGLSNVKVVETPGSLSDHYDPRSKVVRLSSEVYHSPSIASVAVAAHECGHAIQDKDKYIFMNIRSSIVPLVNFASYAGYFVTSSPAASLFARYSLVFSSIIRSLDAVDILEKLSLSL